MAALAGLAGCRDGQHRESPRVASPRRGGQCAAKLKNINGGAVQCSICRGWGFNPPGASQPPKFVLTPKKIVKISQKYIADPLWFSHRSSTGGVAFYDLAYTTSRQHGPRPALLDERADYSRWMIQLATLVLKENCFKNIMSRNIH